MGRGLSKLQRFILSEAGLRRRVYYADILMGFFGWKPRWKPHRYGDERFPAETPEENGLLWAPNSQRFRPREIGEKTYRKVRATLTRSCQRLADRGLIVCYQGAYAHWSGVEITDQGKEWLSVNMVANLPPT